MHPSLQQLAGAFGSKQYPSKEQLSSKLLTVLGDLEEVWRDKQLQGLLLGLPLPAMELLLSADGLQVVSEDTVLYTAVRYVMDIQETGDRSAAKAALAACVRCPQLSLRQLLMQAAATAPTDASYLFTDLQVRLQQLAPLHSGSSRELMHILQTYVKEDWVSGSWLLGPRTWLVPPPADSSVTVTYKLPVEELRAACQHCSSSQQVQDLYGDYSTPLNGIAWRIWVQATSEPGSGSMLRSSQGNTPDRVRVGACAKPLRPLGSLLAFSHRWSITWTSGVHQHVVSRVGVSAVMGANSSGCGHDKVEASQMVGCTTCPRAQMTLLNCLLKMTWSWC